MPALNQRLGLTRYEADEHYKRALDAYGKSNLAEAVEAMTYAINLLPTKAEYYATRGFFQLQDGATREAEADFAQALEIYPYEMLAHYGLGMIAYKAQDWDAAMERFTTAYRVDPKRAETLYYLALVYYKLGEVASAVNVMTRALDAFEASNDRRKTQAERWLRDLAKRARKAGLLMDGGEA
jgi:tetratricopeptide (TPR) repeat protein